MSATLRLTQRHLFTAAEYLARRDRDLAWVIRHHGVPPLWPRSPGFATLVHLILEQQVSLGSALAVFNRLKAQMPVTAEHFAALSVNQLQACGLTRQKSAYCVALAHAIQNRELELKALTRADDETAKRALVGVKGIGPWTADCYLLFCLRRPDVWPDGDLALAESARWLKRLNARPDVDKLRQLAARWAPWRAVGARILWHSYLSGNRGGALRHRRAQPSEREA